MRTIYVVFPDLLNLYGDYANALVLQRTLRTAGLDTRIVPCAYGAPLDLPDAAAVLFHAGTERRIDFARAALLPQITALRDAAASGALLLFTGSAAELAGTEIVTDGSAAEALGLLPFRTTRTRGRQVGDVLCHTAFDPRPVVGFLNKSGFLSGAGDPFFTVDFGAGGIRDAAGNATQTEGYAAGNMLATYLIGPLLSKNPWLCRRAASQILSNAAGSPVVLPDPDMPDDAERAYQATVHALTARMQAGNEA